MSDTYTPPTSPDITSALGDAQTAVLGYITSALPYALGLVGILIGVGVAVKLFRRFAK
jgi:hypothetical protein